MSRIINPNQLLNIMRVLDVAGRDLLIEHTPNGVRVETDGTQGTEGYSCEGIDIVDALGQVTQVLALELNIDIEPEAEGDERVPYAVEPPLEFCQGGCGCVPRPGWCAGCLESLNPLRAVNE